MHDALQRGSNGDAGSGLLLECPSCSTPLRISPPAVRLASTTLDSRVVTLEPTPPVQAGLPGIVRHVEARLVERALREADGVKVHAAELLGMKYSTFWELAERRGVDVDVGATTPASRLDDAERVKLVVPVAGRDPIVVEVTTGAGEGLLRSVVVGCRRELARIALDEARGNVSRASAWLGLPYTTFRHMLERLDLAAEPNGRGRNGAGA